MSRISFIIPTYNCKEYVDDCIGSVLSQISSDDELIVVDDGSTDGTKDRLQNYIGKMNNVKVFFCEHKGASGTRNKGLDEASGEYVTFVDCDDCLKEGFLEKSTQLLKDDIDLYIFGIERIMLEGNREYWTVRDGLFNSVHDFADEYIVRRHLMIYSNCNKFYKRSIIGKLGIRFREDLEFGEDRLFNYEYLRGCGQIMTSNLIMLSYIQRSETSMSTKHIPDYFKNMLMIHKAKMDCFFELYKNVSEEQKRDFLAYDISKEIEMTIDRFKEHPEEVEENLPLINSMLFDREFDLDVPMDMILVLGSSNCGYKVEAAYEIATKNPAAHIIVSGGNIHKSGDTEAEFMYKQLVEMGIDKSRVLIEDRSKYTTQNLELSQVTLHKLRLNDNTIGNKVGIVTAGFHLPRVKKIIEREAGLLDYEIYYFACFGENTRPDNWYQSAIGRNAVLGEFRKNIVRYGVTCDQILGN